MPVCSRIDTLELCETELRDDGQKRNELSLAVRGAEEQDESSSRTANRFSRPKSRLETSTFALVCAAWALLISRRTNEDNVQFIVCSPESTVRAMPNGERTRFQLNVDVSGDQMVTEYLAAVQQQQTDNLTAVGDENSELAPSNKPQALLIIHSSGDVSKSFPTTGGRSKVHLSNDPLVLEIDCNAKAISARMNFSSHILPKTTAQAMLDQLDTATHRLASKDPSCRLSDVDMMTQRDGDTIWEWNSLVPERVDRCVHDIFAELAASQPEAPAVCSWDGSLTYGELDRLSSHLAQRLPSLGADLGSVVPLCFCKSMWTVVAVLGVLKSGSAFLLLDPSIPEERLRYMVEKVSPSLMLTSRTTYDLSCRLFSRSVVLDRDFFGDQESLDQSWQSPRQDASSLMHVIFTSGSTGVPKCVMITHANVASAFHHQASRLGFSKDSRILDFSSYSFTTTISNFFGALIVGGCLCVPSDDERQNRLPEAIRSLEVNVVDLTPSVMQFLVPEELPGVEAIIFGGEAISDSEIARWWGKIRPIHLYGQSECTSNATINSDPGCVQDVRRLGKGAGLVTWIVHPEDHNLLLPVGHVGELLLEGPLVGDGYLYGYEETAAAFIDDPPWLLSGRTTPQGTYPGRKGRLYKTGDLVRYNADASLSFFGRKDAQVKVRGQRVELGEVEHWVKKCTGADKVVAEVIVPQGENASPMLVAFLETPAKDSSPLSEGKPTVVRIPEDVEAKLAQNLPVYMVPTTFFSLPKLPQTATGKMNRKILRDTGASFSLAQLAQLRTSRAPKREPVTDEEVSMQAVWSLVLNIAKGYIGLDDSFFHLGGDSVAAIKAVSEARKVGIRIEVADIFRYPTLAELVATSHLMAEESQPEFQPFSLLGDAVHTTSLLQDVSEAYQLPQDGIQDAYPCTPLQEGILSLASKRTGDYIEQFVLQLAPEVTMEDLQTAWARVSNAVPVLRTRFAHHPTAGLIQVVLDEHLEWNTATELYEYLEADRKQPMELGQPFTRYAIVEDADDITRRWFVLTAHHTLYDGWSVGLITNAIQQAFRGEKIESGPQFQSLVKYIRELDSSKLSDYWSRALNRCEYAPFPTLPPGVSTPRANTVVEREIKHLPRRSRDVTVSTLVRAAWALVVGQMTSSNDVTFGVTTSGRNAPVPGIDAMVAPTFATVPFRVDLAGGQTVSDYLQSVQRQATEMIPYEQAGLHQIAKMSSDCQNACNFQSLLVIQPQSESHGELDGSLGQWMTLDQSAWLNTYALTLEARPSAQGARISARFDGEVLDPDVMSRLLQRFDNAIRQLDGGKTPDTKLSQVELMTVQDQEIIWHWNRDVPGPSNRLIHHIISERALLQPTAPAISAWDGELTYMQLEQQSAQISRHLRDLGIRCGALLPLCFEKSMWTTVAMLAVLKAGAGFVLLEPSLPQERLQAICGQLNSRWILCSPCNANLCSKLSSEVIEVGPELITSLKETDSLAQPEPPPSPTAMCAVFTSGTTGKPKGVVLSHSNFCSALDHQAERLGFHSGARVFDFAAYAFDVAIHNALTTLAVGGCLCVPAEKERWGNLGSAIAEMRATIVNLTPSVARLLDPSAVPCLETLIVGGEAVSLADIAPWWGRVRIINIYGPAECQISTINSNSSTREEATRIGTGAGTVTWIVDPHNHERLMPPYCSGELLIEGPLVGSGYLGEPEKTAAAFIQDPTWLVQGTPDCPGRRGTLYKTGDLVRYNVDGSLTYLGRKDTQVKIRGQRVELTEVEHYAYEAMPDKKVIAAEVIKPRGDNPSQTLVLFVEEKQLSCALPAADQKEDSAATIQPVPAAVDAQLARHLPRHMRPSVILNVQKMPRTTTGKIDRRRLRGLGGAFDAQDLAQGQSSGRGAKRQPVSDTERKMRGIWAEVLGVEASTIGLDDNFFELGGDSIGIMRVVAMARSAGMELAVMDVFRNPSLSIGDSQRSNKT